MVLKRTHTNIIRQDKTQAAENKSPPPVSASRRRAGNLEVAYTMGIQDWITAYRTGINHLRRLPIAAASGLAFPIVCFVLEMLLFYHGYAHAWNRHHSFPWNYVSIMTAAAAMGPAAFVYSHWSLSARRVVLESCCVIVQSHFSGRRPLSWQRVSGVFQEAEHITICYENFAALVIPYRAFPNEQAAKDFYTESVYYWHEAKGMTPPPIPDMSGVWPPAPRPSNSAEPGDTR